MKFIAIASLLFAAATAAKADDDDNLRAGRDLAPFSNNCPTILSKFNTEFASAGCGLVRTAGNGDDFLLARVKKDE